MGAVAGIAGGLLGLGGGGALVKAMVDVGVDVDFATQISRAFADNNFKAFEELTLKLLSQNDVAFDLKNILTSHIENVGNNSSLLNVDLFGGESITGIVSVLAMLAIVLAVIFRDGVPTSVMMAVLGVLTLIGLSLYESRRILKKWKKTVQQACSESQIEMLEVTGGALAQVSKGLLTKASCGPKVSRAIVNKTVEISALGTIYGVVSACENIVHAVSGSPMNFSGIRPDDVEGDSQRVQEQIEELKQSIKSIRSTANDRIDAVATTSERASMWLNSVNGLHRALERKGQQLPMRPDSMLTAKEKESKESVLADVQRIVNNVVEKIRDGMRLCTSDKTVDVNHITDKCNMLIKVLGYHPEMEAKMKQAIMESMQEIEKRSKELQVKSTERSTEEANIRNHEAKMESMKSKFDTKLRVIEGRIQVAKDTVQKCGTGTITMRGWPPGHDSVAQELYNDWMSQRWSKLHPYSSNGFSIVIDATLTPEQKAATEQMTKLVDEAEALKKERQSNIDPVYKECESGKAKLEALKRAEATARELYNKAQRIGEQESWHEFKLKYPNEYAQITLLYDVNRCIGRAAGWIGTVDPDLQKFESLLDELTHSRDYNPKALLPIVKEMQLELEDVDKSTIAFLWKVTAFQLRGTMRPCIEDRNGRLNMQEVLGKLDEFQKVDEKATAIKAITVD